jgi:prepilin-type N-terminal cleavage/methylation domain-containing protein
LKAVKAVKVASRQSGFTLIELLVVISILGILAALAVPALKNLGKSNITVSASAQLLGDVGYARQLALSQRTTVYMVFVPTNFWNNAVWLGSLTFDQRTAATNLCDKQLTGYTFIAYGAAGDQPGRHAWHYLAPWRALPEGTFIALQKFAGTNTIVDQITGASYPIAQFNYTTTIPFPTETSPVTPSTPALPYIAFNYRGQLTDGQNLAGRDEYIPLARGSVSPAIDPSTKAFLLLPSPQGSPSVSEVPPGNSASSSFNLIDIDPLTGRATLRFQKVQ